MRRELKKAGVAGVKAVYSEEDPRPVSRTEGERTIGSISFVPSAAGLLLAGEIVKDIIKK